MTVSAQILSNLNMVAGLSEDNDQRDRSKNIDPGHENEGKCMIFKKRVSRYRNITTKTNDSPSRKLILYVSF